MLRYRVFFFNDTATTEIYTLSLHDALPICKEWREHLAGAGRRPRRRLRRWARDGRAIERRERGRSRRARQGRRGRADADRKSTRLNSSHANISYAVFCLKITNITHPPHPTY